MRGTMAADQLLPVLAQVDDPLALLTGIFFHSPIALQVYRVDGHCLVVNPAFRKLFGTEPPPDYNVLRDEIAEKNGVLGLIRRAFAGEVVEVPPIWYDPRELQQVSVAEGNRIAIESTFFPLHNVDGAVEHVCIVFKDVTTETTLREQGERRRQADEKRLRFQATVLENVRDSIIVTDLSGKIIEWNRGATEVFGYSAEEALGRTPSFLYPDREAPSLAQDLAAIEEGDSFLGEWQGRRKDGSRVWVEIRTTSLRDADGNSLGFIGVGKDVSDRKRAELDRARADEERERALLVAEEASRAKDEFLAMLGHELRNPLNPIVTAIQLIKLRDDGRFDREEQVLERQVNHLVRLVDDLLDVSRITRGKVELQQETFDLGESVNKAVEMASPALEERRHELRLEMPPSGLAVVGDSARLAQVVSNLLTNAARYSDRHGLITVRGWHEGGQVNLSVRDNGIGIEPELLPRIFDLFVQGDRGLDRRAGGLGIGLALVKNLVTLHGGTVTVASEGRGKGSEFVIRLPQAPSDETPARRSPDGPAPAHSRRRVLVVDDNVDSAELVAELLRLAGHEVVVAHDGVTALAAVRDFTPDVAILDIGLPVLDGYQVGRQLREQLAPRELRLVAMTGYGQRHDHARSKTARFDAHLVKPVSSKSLFESLGGRPPHS